MFYTEWIDYTAGKYRQREFESYDQACSFIMSLSEDERESAIITQ